MTHREAFQRNMRVRDAISGAVGVVTEVTSNAVNVAVNGKILQFSPSAAFCDLEAV